MPNETIHLHFVEYDSALAIAMLDAARRFAAARPDGAPGWRRGAGYTVGKRTVWAYWTAARAVVVRECPTNPVEVTRV